MAQARITGRNMQGMTSAQDFNTDVRHLNKALDKSLELFWRGGGQVWRRARLRFSSEHHQTDRECLAREHRGCANWTSGSVASVQINREAVRESSGAVRGI